MYEFIKKPLLKIFNESINLGVFIDKMEIAKVTPIFKSGKKELEKQPLSGVPRKSYFENMQQIYRRTPMEKYDFNKVAVTSLKSHFYMGVLL